MSSNSSSITKTALDSIHAKYSAISLGYKLVSDNDTRGTYEDLLHSLATQNIGNNNYISNHRQNESDRTIKSPPHIQSRNFTKRQTPLVNAGYAVRVSLVTELIQRMLQYVRSKHDYNEEVNILMVGCGLDILGLWAHSLWPSNVKVYEIDCIEICKLKSNLLTSTSMLCHTQYSGKEQNFDTGSPLVVYGRMNIKNEDHIEDRKNELRYTNQFNSSIHNYELLSADLRDVSSVEKALSSSITFDADKITIVLSELVLAYLETCQSDSLMQYFASKICKRNESMFIAYEPVGTASSLTAQSTKTYISPVEGYTTNYYNQFSLKINRGLSGSTPTDEYKDKSMSTMGNDCASVMKRLRNFGFDGPVDCTLVADALRHSTAFSNVTFSEPFDEHAALKLHLCSYGIICASGCMTSAQIFDSVCLWSNPETNTKDMGLWYQRQKVVKESTFYLTSIKKSDQEQVRNLFQNAYVEYYEQYKSIRKMVKTALNTDLHINSFDQASVIWNSYSALQGGFWVATCNRSDDDIDSNRNVVGFIGLKRSHINNISDVDDQVYEIQRFYITPAFQREGLGRSLLDIVESFVRQKSILCKKKTMITASTPSIMEVANKFYTSSGFHILKEKDVGKLNMRTYYKVIK